MPLYKYRAVDHNGEAVDGTMEGASAHRVTAILQERGLHVSSVDEIGVEPGILRVSGRLTWQELDLLVNQLRSIARGGIPMAPAVKALAEDVQSKRLRPVLERLHKDLDAGASLEEALSRQASQFPPLFVSMVRAGEESGNLSGVLQLLAGYTGRIINLRNTLQVALAYPLVVIVASIFIVNFLLTKVVPVFAEIFSEFGGQLPAPTRLLVALSRLATEDSGRILIILAVFFFALFLMARFLRRFEEGRAWLDWIHLHTPLVGRQHYLLSMARFARTLAVLLQSRVPILEGLSLAAASSGSVQLQRAVDHASVSVAGGATMADAFAHTGFFGPQFCWLLSTSEHRNEAEIALDAIADNAEREAGVRDRMISVMATPVLVVAVGLVIGFIIISMYLPIFSLGDQISG
ncbi:MAG: type II secretion system F family protein [Candidatus Hydrogenedentes bacterium]|nr:type II secretion system F family protein [Candidatus Hydrogenedentota bacterium]